MHSTVHYKEDQLVKEWKTYGSWRLLLHLNDLNNLAHGHKRSLI